MTLGDFLYREVAVYLRYKATPYTSSIPTEMMSQEDFLITTSLRSDDLVAQVKDEDSLSIYSPAYSQFYLLDLHRDRMIAATEAFGWPKSSSIEVLALEVHLQKYLQRTFTDSKGFGPLKVCCFS